jgi:hypothetical protein
MAMAVHRRSKQHAEPVAYGESDPASVRHNEAVIVRFLDLVPRRRGLIPP